MIGGTAVINIFKRFQFLYGTIKRALDKGFIEKNANFNSSMVQLKGNANNKNRCITFYFNSSMVQLKGCPCATACPE